MSGRPTNPRATPGTDTRKVCAYCTIRGRVVKECLWCEGTGIYPPPKVKR